LTLPLAATANDRRELASGALVIFTNPDEGQGAMLTVLSLP
jgi:hypothetical protein